MNACTFCSRKFSPLLAVAFSSFSQPAFPESIDAGHAPFYASAVTNGEVVIAENARGQFVIRKHKNTGKEEWAIHLDREPTHIASNPERGVVVIGWSNANPKGKARDETGEMRIYRNGSKIFQEFDVTKFELSANANSILFEQTSNDTKFARVYSVEAKAIVGESRDLGRVHKDQVESHHSYKLSSDGSALMDAWPPYIDSRNVVQLYEVESKKPYIYSFGGKAVVDIEARNKNSIFILISGWLFQYNEARVVCKLPIHGVSLALSPDGNKVLIAGRFGGFAIIDKKCKIETDWMPESQEVAGRAGMSTLSSNSTLAPYRKKLLGYKADWGYDGHVYLHRRGTYSTLRMSNDFSQLYIPDTPQGLDSRDAHDGKVVLVHSDGSVSINEMKFVLATKAVLEQL